MKTGTNLLQATFCADVFIGNVVHRVQNSHSVITWDFSYSTLNIVFSAAG